MYVRQKELTRPHRKYQVPAWHDVVQKGRKILKTKCGKEYEVADSQIEATDILHDGERVCMLCYNLNQGKESGLSKWSRTGYGYRDGGKK